MISIIVPDSQNGDNLRIVIWMSLLKYIFLNFYQQVPKLYFVLPRAASWPRATDFSWTIKWRQLNNIVLNESLKMHFCFASSNRNCIFHFEKKMWNPIYFVCFKNETFKIHSLYFRFFRFYQNCILFLHNSNKHVSIISLLLWILKPIW